MSEFHAVKTATYSPTRCFFCLDFEGPYIDTHMEDPSYGHIYICGPTEKRSGCVGQMAAMFGGLTDLDADRLRGELREARAKIEELERERTITLSYEDARKLLSPKRVKAEA